MIHHILFDSSSEKFLVEERIVDSNNIHIGFDYIDITDKIIAVIKQKLDNEP